MIALFALLTLANPALNPIMELEAPKHAAVTLLKDGEPRFVIVRDVARERKRFVYNHWRENRAAECAADALAENFRLATGREVRLLKVGEPIPPGSAVIHVGRTPKTDALGIDISKLPSEGFVVKTFPGGVAIVGDDTSLQDAYDKDSPHGKHRGSVWGVYDFVERFLGARFYSAGPDGSVHPKVENLVLEPFAYTDAPYFANRGCYYMHVVKEKASKAMGREITGKDITDYQDSFRRAKTIAFTSMHSPFPFQWLEKDPSRLEKAFFRSPYGHWYYDEKNDMNCYFDVFGTDFADMLVESYKTPDGRSMPYNNRDYVVFGQCDGGVGLADAMHDPRVKKLGLLTEKNVRLGRRGFLSDVYGSFYLYVANRLKKELPGRKLIVMPYSQYVYPPTQERFRHLPDNVEAGVCLGDMPRLFPDERRRATAKAILHDWKTVLGGRPALEIWTYAAGDNAFVHDVVNENLGPMIRYFGDDLGRCQCFHELAMLLTALPDNRDTKLSFPHATYVAMRAQWNPAFDAKAALDEYWPLYYGAAGADLKEAHRVLREAYLRVAVPQAKADPVYPQKVVDRVEALLDAAKAKLAADTPEMRRYEAYTFMLRFEIGRQRSRGKSMVKIEDRALQELACEVEGDVRMCGEMAYQTRPYTGWGREKLIYNRSVLLMGDRNSYGINYLVNRPTDKKSAETFINLVEPRLRAGFGREPQNFFGLEINGVKLRDTVPGADAFKPGCDRGESRVEMLADFGGSLMSITAAVRAGSPLLYLKLRHVDGKPVENGALSIHCVPSRLHDTDASKKWKRPPHARELITAARSTGVITARQNIELAESDRYLILQDAVFDGTSREKGYGPSLIVLPKSFAALEKAEQFIDTGYSTTTRFTLKPGFDETEIAILQVNERISNADFPVRFADCLKGN